MLSGNYIPIRTKLLEGELFSSWFTRLAHENAIKPSTMMHYLFNDKQVMNKDVDRPYRQEHLDKLGRICGIDGQTLSKSTVSKFDGVLFTERELGSNIVYILPSTKRMSRIVKPGVQFCPICIKSKPYYKLEYKVALRTICLKHKCYLSSQCGCCGAYINYHLLLPEDDLNICHQCKAVLGREIPILFANRKEYLVERLIKGWLNKGIIKVNNKYIYSYLVLMVVRSWIALITRDSDNVFRKALGLNTPIQGRFEYLEAKVRKQLLMKALTLLQCWPNNFLKFVDKTNYSSYYFYGNMRYVPYWYWSIIQEFIYEPHYVYTDDEAQSAAKYMQENNIKITTLNAKLTLGSSDAIRNRIISRIIRL